MLIKESTIRRIIREEARRVLREEDTNTIPMKMAPVGNADLGPTTKTWQDDGYTYSYNPGNQQAFVVAGPGMTASKQMTKDSNSKAYYTILNQYEDLMDLPKTAPTAPATGMSDPQEIFNMIKQIMGRYNLQLQDCYNKRLKQNDALRGTWVIEFTVKRDGTVKNANAAAAPGTTPDKTLEDCMAKTVASWKFAELAAEQPVTKTVRLAP